MTLILQGCSFTIRADYHKNEENLEENAPVYEVEKLEEELDYLIAALEGTNEEVEILEALKSIYDASDLELSVVFYADTLGDIYVYPEIILPEGYDARTRPWYKAALEQELYLSEPYEDIYGSYMVNISKRVQKNGNTIGIASMDVIVK